MLLLTHTSAWSNASLAKQSQQDWCKKSQILNVVFLNNLDSNLITSSVAVCSLSHSFTCKLGVAKQSKFKKYFRQKHSLPCGGLRNSNICNLREMGRFTSGPHPDGFRGVGMAWHLYPADARCCNCNVLGCLLGGNSSLIPFADLAAVLSWQDPSCTQRRQNTVTVKLVVHCDRDSWFCGVSLGGKFPGSKND